MVFDPDIIIIISIVLQGITLALGGAFIWIRCRRIRGIKQLKESMRFQHTSAQYKADIVARHSLRRTKDIGSSDASLEAPELWPPGSVLSAPADDPSVPLKVSSGLSAPSSAFNLISDKARIGEEIFIPIHYATNRKNTGNEDVNRYYGKDRDEVVHYGLATVSIPKGHLTGMIERPIDLWIIEFSENPQKHIVLRSIKETPKDEFFGALATDIGRLEQKTAFVLIHGFNVTFAAAARRAAQMAYDLFVVSMEKGQPEFSAVPILYSWPSEGETILYTHDINSADASVSHLKNFLKDVAAQSGADSITIVAHSMGNRALAAALNEIGLSMQQGDGPLVQEIILAAPDIDRDVFLNVANAVRRTARRITLYASSQDKALQISKALNGYPRLGDATNGIEIVTGMDSIDASVVGDDILAHSYLGETSVLNDIHSIINGVNPDRRFGFLRAGSPPKLYWIMKPRARM